MASITAKRKCPDLIFGSATTRCATTLPNTSRKATAMRSAWVRSSPRSSCARLVAESGAGVIENLKAIYSGLASGWLHAFEAGDDHKLSLLTGKLHANLEMQARITRELSPGSVHIQNNYLMSDVTTLLKILTPYPEAKRAIVDYYRKRSAAELIEHHDASE